MMPQTRGPGSRTRRAGAAVVAAALAAVAIPATGQAQEATGSVIEETGNGSVDAVLGLVPDEIVIGGTGFTGGSEALRDTGSGVIPDTALSLGETLGSVAPLEAVGVAGGSAAASVASSGVLPGSVYANATGSIGSGTIGVGSLRISEFAIAGFAFQAFAAYISGLAERQEAGTLSPDELVFWNNVVVGSARGGALLEEAAGAAGTELPGGLAGSIDAVQRSALENPFEAQDRIRAEIEAQAEAEARAENGEEAGAGGEDAAGAATRVGDEEGDDDEVGASPAGTARTPGAPTGAGTGIPTLAAATGAVAPVAQGQTGGPAVLAATGVETTAVAGLAAVSLLLGTLLLVATRRRV